MVARFVSGRNLLPRGVCTQWKPVGNTLGGDENVGIHSVMLDSKHFPATRESGLHFVSDEQNAMLVKDPFYFSEIVRRRNQNSALAHHRLSNKCRDIVGCGKSDYILNRTRALLPAFFGIVWPLRTIDVGCGSKRNPRCIRTAAFLASLIPGNAKRAPSASVKTGMQGDELMFPGVKTGQFHCAFNGLRSAIAEECLCQAARRNVSEFLGQVCDRLHVVQV